MALKNVGIPLLVGYLALFWGAVAALLVFITSNSAPGEPGVKWKDEDIRTTTKLVVEIETEAPDADGDKVAYAYTWTKNGEPLEDMKSSSITSRQTMAGETWAVTLVPDDGTRDGWGCSLPWRTCAGEVSTTLTAEIGNTPPRARIAFVDAEGNPIETYDKRQDVTVEMSCFDPDVIDIERALRAEQVAAAKELAKTAPPEPEPEEAAADGEEAEEEEAEDPCTYTVAWYPGTVEEITEETEPASTELTMSWRDLRAEESWKVVAIANDGTDDGEPVEEILEPTP